ncbi:hypothetical protein ACWDFR_44440 [Streptomyces sp. 900105755]
MTGEVTWLLDDAYAGKDTAAPYQWTVTATTGSHKLKARWVTDASTGATASVTADFTVTASPPTPSVGRGLPSPPPRRPDHHRASRPHAGRLIDIGAMGRNP